MKTKQTDSSSRSDQVRQRRSQKSQERATRAAKQARYASVAPTVFVRGSMALPPALNTNRGKNRSSGISFQPVINRAKTNPRRKVAIPLGSSGAEMIMPALPQIQVGWRVLSALLVIVLGFGLYTAWNSPQFTVGLPEVSGLERLSVDDIETILELEGTPIFLIDQNALYQNVVDAFPELKEISVSVSLPNHVSISAVERQPVIAWNYEDDTIWIDEEGAIFPVRGHAGEDILHVSSDVLPPLSALPADLLALEQALEDGEEADGAPIERTSSGVSVYQRQVDPSIRSALMTITEKMPSGMNLAYHASEGFGWHDDRGWDVYFGQSLENLETKLALYEKIVEQLNQQGQQPVFISVAHIHAPFYRLEQ